MKRSEMVDEIHQYLWSNFPTIEASDILDIIERKGMLPPSRIFKSIPWGFQMEWEPEDEN